MALVRAACPVARFERFLLDAKHAQAGALAGLGDEVQREVDAAEEFARASSWPRVEEVVQGV